MAWQKRQQHRLKNLPSLLLGKDIDDFRTQAGINRAVLNALRRFGFVPPEPEKTPRLRLVETDDKRER